MRFGTLLLLAVLNVPPIAASNCEYAIYIDADFTSAKVSSESIRLGINTAFGEVDHALHACRFRLVEKDHKASPLLSRDNLHAFNNDPEALLVFSGLHSPPVLSNKSFINKHKILYLVPWAAAGPITRSDGQQNWIFRLSIDDTKAGRFISRYALKQGFTKPYLLLEDTGWGRSNHVNMQLALSHANIKIQGVSWFKWNLSEQTARGLLAKVIASSADVLFFVGNAPEGTQFVQASARLAPPFTLPIRSHWGITGGSFFNEKTADAINRLDLQFIQTRFSFLHSPLTEFEQQVLSNAIKMNPEITKASDIQAQTGFAHAYDLSRLLIAAIHQAGLTGQKQQDLAKIHYALEHLDRPTQGLLKTYLRPFKPYSVNAPDAHEALSEKDYAMGSFTDKGQIRLVNFR